MDQTPLAELAGARAGDRRATEALVRRVGRIALPLAVSVLGDRDHAGDVAQDVAVDALSGLTRLRNPEAFEAWVRQIAVRRTLRAARARRRRRNAEVPLAELTDETPADDAPALADAVTLRGALLNALATLPPRQRLALVLRYVHGLSDAEIAAALGCRPGTVPSLLSRGRAALSKDGGLTDVATNPVPGGV